MSDTNTDLQSRREAVQPSLWDRLVDDLPGLVAESGYQYSELLNELGEDKLEEILKGGARAVEHADDLGDSTRKRLHKLIAQTTRRSQLEASGIVVTADVLREAVRRDIEMLFNIERLEAQFLLTDREMANTISPAELLSDFPLVRRSVVNYGVPSFTGKTGDNFDRDRLARELRDVLAVFEPRLKRDSIKVRLNIDKKTGMKIEIDGVLMLSPAPERLRLSTTINLDSGQAVTALEDN